MEITRSSILREVLTEKEDQMYRYSKYRAGLTPLEGYEKIFEDLKQTCDLLRGMIRGEIEREREDGLIAIAQENREALMHPGIQKQLADWQKELMAGKKPGVEWADQQVTRTPDELLRRRRHNRAEGFKPEPVIKTDESGVYVNGEKVLPKPVVYPGGEE